MKFIKSFILVVGLAVFSQSILSAQITLDHIYQNASLNLYMVNLEVSGMKYVQRNTVQGNRFLKFYNLDHSLWKTIDCNPFTIPANCVSSYQWSFDALYISENLFDCDDAIEFMYAMESDCRWFTAVYKENGTALLVADSCGPFVSVNIPQQQKPIYNTPDGTKMILSHKNGSAKVYDLPCSLNAGIDKSPVLENNPFSVFPNPASEQITVEYNLPDGISQAELIIYDMAGNEVRRYTVDNTFSNIIINQNSIASGTYFYSLMNNNQIIASKKVIVVK